MTCGVMGILVCLQWEGHLSSPMIKGAMIKVMATRQWEVVNTPPSLIMISMTISLLLLRAACKCSKIALARIITIEKPSIQFNHLRHTLKVVTNPKLNLTMSHRLKITIKDDRCRHRTNPDELLIMTSLSNINLSNNRGMSHPYLL